MMPIHASAPATASDVHARGGTPGIRSASGGDCPRSRGRTVASVPPPKQVLTKHQRNEIFRAIQESGALVTAFTLDAGSLLRDKGRISMLIHHPGSKSTFVITPVDHGGYKLAGELGVNEKELSRDMLQQLDIFRRGLKDSGLAGPRRGVLSRSYPSYDWDEVPPLIALWARGIVRIFSDYHEADLWAELENTPFAGAELARISKQIQELKTYITNIHDLTADQTATANKRLDDIEDASRHLGRKDWLMMLNSAVFGLILTDTLTAQVAQHAFSMVLQGLGHLFGLGGPPPYLPPVP
jgi:hypothetical protein